MENVQGKARLHPLVAGAAAAVIVASAVGVAAVGGYLPGSKAEQQDRAAVGKTSADTRKAANARGATRVAAACTECGVVVGVKVGPAGVGVGWPCPGYSNETTQVPMLASPYLIRKLPLLPQKTPQELRASQH